MYGQSRAVDSALRCLTLPTYSSHSSPCADVVTSPCRWNHDLGGIMLSYTNLHLQSSEVLNSRVRQSPLWDLTADGLASWFRSSELDVKPLHRYQILAESHSILKFPPLLCCRRVYIHTSHFSMWMSPLMWTYFALNLGTPSVSLQAPVIALWALRSCQCK